MKIFDLSFKKPDYFLLTITFLILSLGLLFLFSASAYIGEKYYLNPYYFVILQIKKGLIPGLLLLIFSYFVNLRFLKKASLWLFIFSIVLTYAVFVPGIGIEKGGAKRWIQIGSFQMQPSEVLKFSFLIYLSAWLSCLRSKRKKLSKKIKEKKFLKDESFLFDFIPFIFLLGITSLALLLEPDVGTLALILSLSFLIYFISGTSLWHSLILGIIIILGIVSLVLLAPYRLERILVFFNPNLDPLGAGYHLRQSLIAIGSGGLLGRGFGLSHQKLGFLPATLSDSIFSVIAEETGFLGSLAFISLYLLFFYRVLKISAFQKEKFAKLLSLALGSHILTQAFLNIFALTGIIPLTGMPLPLVSLGGSSMSITLAEIGILLNISKQWQR